MSQKQRDVEQGGVVHNTNTEPASTDNIQLTIHGSPSAYRQSTSTANLGIQARRSGSATVLQRNEHGHVVVERKGTDLTIAVQRRLSQSSLPSIIPIAQPDKPPTYISADNALEKTGGKGAAGAYSEHMYPLEVLAEKFQTHINFDEANKSRGLTSQLATDRLKEMGPNVLTPPPKVPLWVLFLLQFTNLLMILLQITALLCIILFFIDTSVWDNLYLGVLLYIVVIITCYETYSQEAKSDSLMEQFRAMVPEKASVVRDGVMKPMDTSELVVGDVIRLKSGDKVPADCRIIFNESMKVDQSMITGESEPVDSMVVAHDPNALEAKNIIFNGSLVVDGGCYAVVIRTGDATLIGTLVEMTGDVGKAASTLKQDIEYFVKVLTIFALLQAASVFIVGLSRGLNPIDVFIQGFVVIMVGNVPQGLPTTVTACLYLVAESMGKQNVFVKKLDIIETLGCCTLICTDKTGTLTMNQMTVANAWLFDRKFIADDFKETCKQESTIPASGIVAQCLRLLQVAALNSRVVLEKKTEDSPFEPNGDATELGLYRFCRSCLQHVLGKDIEDFRHTNPKVHEIPFNSSFKWQMSIHSMPDETGSQSKQILFLKGAPDVLLGKCSHYIAQDGSVQLIDANFQALYTKVYEEFGGGGERVLGFAMKPMARTIEEELAANPAFKDKLREDMIGKKTETPTKDLIFVGLITLLDPPRPEVPQAVKDCHTAGVKVVMVTGDHPLTAAAIARKIGLITKKTRDDVAKEKGIAPTEVKEEEVEAVVVHGSQIPAMTEDDWKVLVSKQEIVFARTSPEQKLIIVKEFTKAGNVTAMTGDGVNDSPALKQAAIGIAMGLNGSAVAKEAADVVLLDDNFASIVVGIREGRKLFANLKKSIAYTLAHLTPEVLPVLIWGYGGIPQPVGSLLILCIDLLTELVPATSFAFEKAESLIMQVPPRDLKKDRLTSFQLLFYAYGQAGIIITIACFLVYFRTFQFYDIPASAIWGNNNKYFPLEYGNYVTPSGKVYDENDQQHILNVVRTGWFLMIVAGQAVHIWCVRTSTVSIFEHGVFSNSVANYGVVIALLLGIFVAYTPGVRLIVGSANPLSLELLYGSLLVAGTLIIYTESRKWFTRTYPTHWLNKWLAW